MRSVLITGGAMRVGRELSLRLGMEGWHVLVHYRASRNEAEEVVRLIEAAGGIADALPADLERLEDVHLLAANSKDMARLRGSNLVALVNNASLFEYDTVDSMTTESWRRHIDVNLRAPVLLAKLLANGDVDDGCVVNILDNKVEAPNPDYFSYTIAKQALAAATKVLALALAPKVRVCGVAPGITLISGAQTAEEFERAHRANPLGRGCTVDQIARAVHFILATPSLTGQTIVIDGGQSLTNPGRDVAFLAD